MADNFRFAQLQPYTLAGAGAVIGDTSVILSSMLDIDGAALSMATTFGTIGYGTLDPGNGELEEQISFTGITNNSNGTVTLTGVKTVLFTYPYTETSGLAKTHAGSTPFVISNTSGFYNKLTSKEDDETITGQWTFPDGANRIKLSADTDTAVNEELITFGQLARTALAGAVKATVAVYGLVRMSVAPASAADPVAVGDNDPRVPTQGENDALVGNNTDIAVGTGNKFVTQTGLQHNAEKYAADAGANDTYVITLSPAPTAYTNGMVVYFKANTANTGTATLNVNGLGAVTIVKGVSTTLDTGDILSGQFVTVMYNGTNFVLQNPTGINTSVPTISTLSILPLGVTGSTTRQYQDNTIMALGAYLIPARMTLNKLSFNVTAVGASGTLDITMYSEDGQTQLFSVTTATISGTGIVSTAISSVVVQPGIYYIGINTNSTANITVSAWTASPLSIVSGEPGLNGEYTITASTPPATITPGSIVSANVAAIVRLDN